ncbi:holin family protein [Andreesenia angusta]|uniref:Holin family protein n=1 Tax=Andreesenia angusta TaxID=39480 RepID=A0A1S1V681_9FIRM|nr:phage holin family protein [Andreesenia angusta]OHW62153.1 holin family protein [Andreesenia angusta]
MEKINLVKTELLYIAGIIGSAIAHSLGGWDKALATLALFMAVDYVTGFILAIVFKKSPKTESGGASSKVGFKGLCKKGVMLLIVLVAHGLDSVVGSDFIRDGVIIAFIVNETLSIIENAGQMGLDPPSVLVRGVEILKSKNEEE